MGKHGIIGYQVMSLLFVVNGITAGIVLRDLWTQENDYKKLYYMQLPGRVMLNILELMVAPRVIFCVVTTTFTLESSNTGAMGFASILFYTLSTLGATAVGVLVIHLTLTFTTDMTGLFDVTGLYTSIDSYKSFIEMLCEFFPENLIAATYERTIPNYENQQCISKALTTKGVCPGLYTMSTETLHGANVFGLLGFSLLFGFVVNQRSRHGRPLKDFFKCIDSVIFTFFEIFSWYLPFGSAFLIAHHIITTENVNAYFNDLSVYVLVILGTMAVYNWLVLPVVYAVVACSNPVALAFQLRKLLFEAWLKVFRDLYTVDSLINEAHMSPKVVRFVSGERSYLNQVGASITVAVSTVYIISAFHYPLSLVGLIVIGLTSAVSSITTFGLPQSALTTLVIVLTAVGLPVEHVCLILPVDWLLEHFREVTKVWNECIGAGILNHFFQNVFRVKSFGRSLDLVESDLTFEVERVKELPKKKLKK